MFGVPEQLLFEGVEGSRCLLHEEPEIQGLQQGELGEFHPIHEQISHLPIPPEIHISASTVLLGQPNHPERSELQSNTSKIHFYRRWAPIPREFRYLEKEARSSELHCSGRKVGVCSKWLLRILSAKERRIKEKRGKKENPDMVRSFKSQTK